MRILKEKTQYHEYAFESEYNDIVVEYCQYLKNTLGWKEFSWDADNKVWRFTDPSLITVLKGKFEGLEFNVDVKNDLESYEKSVIVEEEKAQNAERIKESTVSTISVKGIKGNLYEYQKLGVEFLVNSGGRALLADSPGVGKTAQTLGYITHVGHKRSLIVCPASVKFAWESEIEKWTDLKSFVVEPKTDLESIPFDVNCVIVNYDILKKFYNEFMKYKFDCLVCDESHLIKSPTAQRSKIIKLLARNIPNIIMLTGTPVLSRPIEMFNVLSMIDPKKWNNYYQYATKYCDGKQGYWGFEAKGATNLAELKEKISKYFLRRTKEEVLSQLPPKNRVEVPIDLPEAERTQYELVEENLVKYLKTYKKDKTDKQILKSMAAERLVKLNLLREINAMGKITTAKELIDGIIEADEKVIVFSSFNAPLQELADQYEENSVLLLGSTPIDERGEMVKKFQTDPNCKIFFGGTRSAGVGITLTAASNVIFLDLPWNPADLDQGENRAHRPGAEYECLNIYQIISKGTIDGFMKKLLSRKQEIIDQLIEGKETEEEDSMLDEYINSLKLKYKK
jgi:SWI/SNF-related matrix-associated actin-dependent regulator 1 of chromatin subfamily A